MKKIITTANDYKIFKDEVLKWIQKYNLNSWEIIFVHEDDDTGALANVVFDIEARHAIFTLGKDWTIHKGGKSASEIRATARHEVRHLLIGRIYCYAMSRSITKNEIDEEIHSVINALENAGKE